MTSLERAREAILEDFAKELNAWEIVLPLHFHDWLEQRIAQALDEREKAYAEALRGVHAEYAEELDAARAEPREEDAKAMKDAKEALDSIWAAIGDALCSGKGIEKAYANSVANECRAASDALARAQKPAR